MRVGFYTGAYSTCMSSLTKQQKKTFFVDSATKYFHINHYISNFPRIFLMSALLDLKLLRYLSPSSKRLRQESSYLGPAARTHVHCPSRKVIFTGPWGSVKPRNSSYSSSGSMVSPGSKLSTIWLSASFSSMIARLRLFSGQLHSSVRI